jgi:hypothetical protein
MLVPYGAGSCTHPRMTDHSTNGVAPDVRRLRLHAGLRERLGDQLADDLMGFLPPAGWGDLVRRADLDAAVSLLDHRMDSLEHQLNGRMDSIEQLLREVKTDVRNLGNIKRTIVATGVSMTLSVILGLGALEVAFLQAATATGG